jgi:hypoxanthine phosphoribosyltransferase
MPTVIIALGTTGFQLADLLCRTFVVGVAIGYALAILDFAAYGRRETKLSSNSARCSNVPALHS